VPGASFERLELAEATLRVWVRARPVEGQANAAIEEAIANALGLRRRQARIVSGATSRRKLIEIDIASLDVLRECLQ
jgi:uncharacterized protein YggU (UPF0235/DUF167 family)